MQSKCDNAIHACEIVGLEATCVTNQTRDNVNFGFKQGTCEKLVGSNVNNLQGFTWFFPK